MATEPAWAGETVELTGDVTSTATALADATGLSLAVPAAGLYIFRFWVVFQSAATTTGIQLSINGPAQTLIVYTLSIPTSVTAQTHSNRRAYNSGAASGGVDVADANVLSWIDGVVLATAAGDVIVRFATEVGGSTVTIKAGSGGRIRRMDNPA